MLRNRNKMYCLAMTIAALGLSVASLARAEDTLKLDSPPLQAPSESSKAFMLADSDKSWDDFTDGWRVKSRPSMWFAGLKGTVGKGDRKINVDASFADLFDKLDFGAGMDVEVGKGKWSFLFNGLWERFEADGSTPRGRISANAKMDFAIVDAAMAYRFLDISLANTGDMNDRFVMDALGGARWTYLSTDIKLKGGPLGGISKNGSVYWVDPYVGLRATYYMNKNLDVSAMGTVGGFDVGSKLAWSAAASVEYRFTQKIGAFVGYKILSYDYDLRGFVWDVKMHGPIAGLTIRW